MRTHDVLATFTDGAAMPRLTRLLPALLVVTCLVAPVTTTAQPQVRTARPESRQTIDRYYAAFAAMTRDPRGGMDRWITFYADSALFEDPTANQSAVGQDSIRRAYMQFFTTVGGPSAFRVLRRAQAGDWTAVEGTLDGTMRGKRFQTRFTTWFRLRGDRIVHQIDYLDYASMRNQVRDSAPAVPVLPLAESRASGDRPTSSHAVRAVVDSFYAYFNRVAVDSNPAINRMFAFIGDPFQLEDPTHDARFVGARAEHRAAISASFLANRWGPDTRWELARVAIENDWAAVEGTFRGTLNGKPFAARFTTWLQVRGGRVVHQIDYLDYRVLRQILHQR